VPGRAERDHVFVNRRGEPLTRFGIHAMVERYVARIVEKMPSVATKRVSPHTIRHTTATHLLRAGVNIKHDPRLAGTRVAGDDQRVRGGRSGNEGQGAGHV